MTKTPDELLALRIGGATVADNIQRAIESGKLIEDPDGSLRLAHSRPNDGNWAKVNYGPPLGCNFLANFLFYQAYAQSAVPQGCSACYKVKVVLHTLRELVAAWGVAKRIECQSKWGIDLHNRFSQNIYAGYFYASGLDGARAIFKVVRDAFSADPKLGPDIAISIKRGCSDFEAALGPSDRYEFAPELAELEAYLKTRFRANEPSRDLPPVPMARWIDVAFCVGDDTYLDFTGGKRLRPKMVSYDP